MITVNSKQEKYAMNVSNGSTGIISDIPASHGGSGKYLAPFDLLCSSFAACLTATTRLLLEKRGVAYDEVIAKVSVDQNSVPGKTMFSYDIQIKGSMSDADKAKYAKMAFNGCPIHKALSNEITFDEMK